jgi:hypothetical protein
LSHSVEACIVPHQTQFVRLKFLSSSYCSRKSEST